MVFGDASRAEGKVKTRPSETRFVTSIAAISFAALLLFMVVAWLGWLFELSSSPLLEAYKILLQFLLITTIGGVLVWALNIVRDLHLREEQRRKEAEEKRAERVSAIRSLQSRAIELYRRFIATKRKFRSYSSWRGHDDEFEISFRKEDFLDLMEELLQTQIGLEILRENVAARGDLFHDMEKDIEAELRYVARYLHDVYQEFEESKIAIKDSQAIVGSECKMLRDFISQKDVPGEIDHLAKNLRSGEAEGTLTMAERHELLVQIETELKKLRKGRYASVASAFANLAMDHMQDAVNRWLDSPIATPE